MSPIPHIPIAIIGTGFAGLGMSIRLKQSGISDFLVFERASGVGGTWRDNTYPGCACDVESHVYSFSFFPNPDWSRKWSPQPEILRYLQRAVTHFQLESHLRLDQTLKSARWDLPTKRWHLTFPGGAFTCQFLISAMGGLSEPQFPRIEGLEQFQGKVFHSARWDHTCDLHDKNVSVIGTGASAVQFVPEIQPKVKTLTLFQRTAPWILPLPNADYAASEKRRNRRFPFLQKLARLRIYLYRESIGFGFRHPKYMKKAHHFATNYLRRKISDPGLRTKMTPDYQIGCKRILLSSQFLPAITKSNVGIVTEAIAKILPHAVLTCDGVEHPSEVIVLGTGFRMTELHLARHLYGKAGVTLKDTWKESPRAFLGTTIPQFPNYFMLFGPNTGLGHNSVVLMAEAQIAHILKAIKYLRSHRLTVLEPRPEVQTDYNEKIDRRMARTVWTSGCRSWYLDPTGRNSALWPGSTGSFRRRVARFDSRDYLFDA